MRMQNIQTQTLNLTIRWLSGAKTRYTIQATELPTYLALYTDPDQLRDIRKITVKVA